jgi:protein-S-isoprenylcysteine O-methyltransferase Ste14
MEESRARGQGFRIPPPLLYLFPLLSGYIIQHFVPIHLVSGAASARTLRLVGWAEIAIALALMAWSFSTFRRLQTPVLPGRPARLLVQEGPYSLTRNPIYLGLALIYVGIVFVTNALWPLVFLPEALALTFLFAIRLEEQYLAQEFGDAFREYRSRVRRWI